MKAEPVSFWYVAHPQQPMPQKLRRIRCCSCGQLLEKGQPVVRYSRHRQARSSWERRTYGPGYAPVPLADWYHCLPCAKGYQELEALTSTPFLNANVEDQLNTLIDETRPTKADGERL